MSTKPDTSVSALIGLGGNVGDVVAAMQRALDTISAHPSCALVAISNIYKTPPWGKTDQDWFFNACAQVQTSLDAATFLDLLLSIEKNEGRVREERWGPRTLDMDILDFGGQKISTERLTVPHPRMFERAFVVVPLLDIAPELVIAGRSLADYADEMDVMQIERAEAQLTISSS